MTLNDGEWRFYFLHIDERKTGYSFFTVLLLVISTSVDPDIKILLTSRRPWYSCFFLLAREIRFKYTMNIHERETLTFSFFPWRAGDCNINFFYFYFWAVLYYMELGIGNRSMTVIDGEWRWMTVDDGECGWMTVNDGEWGWMTVNDGGWRWMTVDDG